jgi:hypothetical protein
MTKSNKEIQADYKKRMREKGMEHKAFWVFGEDWPEIKKFIEGKNKKRLDKVTSNI